jgi:hypothetical protein
VVIPGRASRSRRRATLQPAALAPLGERVTMPRPRRCPTS